MKLRFLFLLAVLGLGATALGQEPKKPVEYNVGVCSSRVLALVHVAKTEQKISFDYYVDEDGSVVEDRQPITFDYKLGAPLREGEDTFQGVAKIGDSEVKISGLFYRNRVVALITVDGNLAYVFYGVQGTKDDLVKVKDAVKNFCGLIRKSESIDDLAQLMSSFLHAEDAKGPQEKI